MKRILLVSALAIGMGGCSFLSTNVTPAATSAEASVDHAFARLNGFVRDNVKAPVERADAWLKANAGPALDNGVHAFFCNKYAQRAFDPSEAKNQPACTAGTGK